MASIGSAAASMPDWSTTLATPLTRRITSRDSTPGRSAPDVRARSSTLSLAATGYRREHEDTDVSILASDVRAFVEFMQGRWHVWNNVGGVLHPLGDRWKTADDPRSQLWLRADAVSP